MFRHLLVPLDGSRLAEGVLPVARLFARRLAASITLLHIVERRPHTQVHGQRHLDDPQQAQTYLDGLTGRLRHEGLDVRCHVHEVAEGDVARSIVQHAHELASDLIMLTTHGRGGMRGLLVGSVAQQVLGSGLVPVLVVHPDAAAERYACRRIAVPLDGESHDEHSLPVARELAPAFSARVLLVTVVPRPKNLRGARTAADRLLPPTTTAELDLREQEAVLYLKRVAAALRDAGIAVSGQVRRGDPAAELRRCFREAGVELTVVATHALKGWTAFWEGSVTPGLVSRWRGPCLLVRAGGGRAAEDHRRKRRVAASDGGLRSRLARSIDPGKLSLVGPPVPLQDRTISPDA